MKSECMGQVYPSNFLLCCFLAISGAGDHHEIGWHWPQPTARCMAYRVTGASLLGLSRTCLAMKRSCHSWCSVYFTDLAFLGCHLARTKIFLIANWFRRGSRTSDLTVRVASGPGDDGYSDHSRVEARWRCQTAPIVTVETGAMLGYISHSIAHCALHSLHAPLPCPAYLHSHYLHVTGGAG